MVEIREHYRPTDDGHVPGVYRVVGASDEVTLLRITDGRGRRVHTGELLHVSPSTVRAEFESADNPDAGLTPASDVRNLLSGLYWSVRRFF